MPRPPRRRSSAAVVAADPTLARRHRPRADRRRSPDDLPRLTVRSRRPPRLAVVAGSERALAALRATADRSGWRTVGGQRRGRRPAGDDPPAARPDGRRRAGRRGRPAAARRALDDRRAGRRSSPPWPSAVPSCRSSSPAAMSEGQAAFGDVGDSARRRSCSRPAARARGRRGGDPLAAFLLGGRPARSTTHAAPSAPATQTLADVLDRRVETIVLGHDAVGPGERRPGGRRRDGARPGWPWCRRRRSHRTNPTMPSSTASSCGRPSRPTGTACATGCASCASPRGPTWPARAPPCAWPPPGRPWGGSSTHTPGAAWSTAPDLVVTVRRRLVAGPGTDRHPGHRRCRPPHRAPASTPSTTPGCSASLGAIPDPDERRLLHGATSPTTCSRRSAAS